MPPVPLRPAPGPVSMRQSSRQQRLRGLCWGRRQLRRTKTCWSHCARGCHPLAGPTPRHSHPLVAVFQAPPRLPAAIYPGRASDARASRSTYPRSRYAPYQPGRKRGGYLPPRARVHRPPAGGVPPGRGATGPAGRTKPRCVQTQWGKKFRRYQSFPRQATPLCQHVSCRDVTQIGVVEGLTSVGSAARPRSIAAGSRFAARPNPQASPTEREIPDWHACPTCASRVVRAKGRRTQVAYPR